MSETWNDAVNSISWQWKDWTNTVDILRDTACQHSALRKRSRDEQLQLLLRERKCTPTGQRRDVDKRIYRRRRYLKRKRVSDNLIEAASMGCAPPQQRSNSHIPWTKLVGDGDPERNVRQHFECIYSLEPHERTIEEAEKQKYVALWRNFRIDLAGWQLSVVSVQRLLKKLKRGKVSPDGVTAEMLQALPEATLASFTRFLMSVIVCLDIPVDWCQTFATLLPKCIGASTLAKYRPIASLPATRKLLGYMFIQMLPPLRFESFQTGFVPKAQAAAGVYVMKRAAELSREWGRTIYVAQ